MNTDKIIEIAGKIKNNNLIIQECHLLAKEICNSKSDMDVCLGMEPVSPEKEIIDFYINQANNTIYGFRQPQNEPKRKLIGLNTKNMPYVLVMQLLEKIITYYNSENEKLVNKLKREKIC